MSDAAAKTESAGKEGEAAPTKKRSRLVVILGVTLLMGALGSGTAYWLLRTPALTPPDELKLALKQLDEGALDAAKGLAQKLVEADYVDPDFPGGPAFVVGVATFRQAQEAEPDQQEAQYIVASTFLQDAESRKLLDERRPMWAWALGLSQYRTGSVDEAVPKLEEAFQGYPPGRLEAGKRLLDAYLQNRDPANLDKALELNTTLLADAELPAEDRVLVRLHRAQILIGKGQRTQAAELLDELSHDPVGSKGTILLRAQIQLDEKKPAEAIQTLAPLAQDEEADPTFVRQASYLMGIGALALNQLEDAVGYFERTSERFEGTDEELAARLLAADALRRLGRKEEALEEFGLAFRRIRRPEKFRNRWMDLARVRELGKAAWTGWVSSRDFSEAIAMAEMAAPAIPADEAHDLAARANQMWAEHVDTEVRALPPGVRQGRMVDVRKRFHDAGVAFARLADTRQNSRTYYDSLWTSAEDFFRANEYASCIAQIDRLLATGPANLIPEALVRRAEARLNIGDYDGALEDFLRVLKEFPTDPAAIAAYMSIGRVRWERNEMDLAESSWRSLLNSKDLRPEALEWRQALFCLSRLLVSTADAELRVWDRDARGGTTTPAQMEKLVAIAARFTEAVLKLDEFLERYPGAEEREDARFLLAKALARRSRLARERFNLAETDSARAEYRQKYQDDLSRSIDELAVVRDALVDRRRSGNLDSLGEATLKQTLFEYAHALYQLDDYDGAIEAYSSLAGRYQQDGEVLGVYVQIANCFRRMNRSAEAASTLAQARLLLKQLPESAFVEEGGRLSRDEWGRWLEWASQQTP